MSTRIAFARCFFPPSLLFLPLPARPTWLSAKFDRGGIVGLVTDPAGARVSGATGEDHQSRSQTSHRK